MCSSGSAEVPEIEREEKLEPHRARIAELYSDCKGNLVRVHEELVAEGCKVSYQGLTAFCRRHGLGHPPRPPAGQYHFAPGEEMQHDTSPHLVVMDGVKKRAQCASLVDCTSKLLFFQYYPLFRRFECKVFLRDGVEYFRCCCRWCMVDNTHVIVLRGTGKDMVPVPEMAAFGESIGFEFRAHEKGDANRSARVERPFDYIDNNFNAGRTFRDWRDLNRQAVEWCDKVNATWKRSLRASPRELFVAQRPHMCALPDWLPEVYQLHQRIVDVEGYVSVSTNRYSVPLPVGRRVEVRETKETIDVYDGPRLVARHERIWEPLGKRVRDPAHFPARPKRRSGDAFPEEQTLLGLAPELASYVTALKARSRGATTKALRRLLGMLRDYPKAPILAAVSQAATYGLFDLDRLEAMVLKRIAHDYFLLEGQPESGEPRGPE